MANGPTPSLDTLSLSLSLLFWLSPTLVTVPVPSPRVWLVKSYHVTWILASDWSPGPHPRTLPLYQNNWAGPAPGKDPGPHYFNFH